MTNSVKHLTQNMRVRLGVYPDAEFSKSDDQGSSHVSKVWNARKCPSRITSPLTVFSHPVWAA